MSTLRLLLVTNSASVTHSMANLAENRAEIEIVGTAKTRKEAIQKIQDLNPDVLIVDSEMRRMAAIDTVRNVMHSRGLPVVMVTQPNAAGSAITIQAIADGAIEFIDRPTAHTNPDAADFGDDAISKIVFAHRTFPGRSKSLRIRAKSLTIQHDRLVVIAGATGSCRSLIDLFEVLPLGLRCPILVALSLETAYLEALVRRLDRMGVMHCAIARAGDCAVAGQALFAPSHCYVRVHPGGEIDVHPGAKIGNRQPTADVLFLSAARAYAAKCMGIILSNSTHEAVQGARALQNLGGTVLAERMPVGLNSDGFNPCEFPHRDVEGIAHGLLGHTEQTMLRIA